MTVVKVHIDTKGYSEKPKDFSTIKPRTQNNKTIQEIEIKKLIERIEHGYTISPGILNNGMCADNWIEQTLFMVDIDNDNKDLPTMYPNEALSICEKHKLSPIFYYPSFSNSESKPKYRLVFLMDKVITNKKDREKIVKTLISLFPQSDKSCKNADRIFFGTNSKAIICNLNARISMYQINNIKEECNEYINEYILEEGIRNNTLFIKACKLCERGVSKKEILLSIRKENKTKCNPKLSDKEINTIVNSAIKHVSNIPPYIYREVKNDKVKYEVSSQLLANYIREHAHYFLVKENANEKIMIFWYSNGVYKNINEEMMKGYIKSYITTYNMTLYKSSIVNEVFKDLTTDLNFISQEELNSNENIINFKNGLYDLEKKKLIPHTPNIISTIQIPCNWNESKTINAPVFESYLNTLTNGDIGSKSFLLQFMGACISNIKGYRFKKALFLVGDGDTGKSQIKSLTEQILGKGNYTGIDLSELEERFGTSMIYNKRLAGSSDMSFISVKELKQFKKITGGDSLFTEFKGCHGFDQVYNGLLWFCCNKLPKFSGDNGIWVYNRIVVLRCKNVIPKEKQDKYLLDKMLEEKESIVKLAINELQKAIENGYEFIISDEIKRETKIYKQENNTVACFIRDCCTKRKTYNDDCSCKKMYDVYVAYCKDNNNGYAKTQKEFKQDLIELSNSSESNIIKRTSKNTFYIPYTITLDTYIAYRNIFGYNQFFENQRNVT